MAWKDEQGGYSSACSNVNACKRSKFSFWAGVVGVDYNRGFAEGGVGKYQPKEKAAFAEEAAALEKKRGK